jgi:hypothetical protein
MTDGGFVPARVVAKEKKDLSEKRRRNNLVIEENN